MNVLKLIGFVWYLFYAYKLYKREVIIPQKYQPIFMILLGVAILLI